MYFLHGFLSHIFLYLVGHFTVVAVNLVLI